MRKLIIIAIFALLPVFAFSGGMGLQVGPTAFYNWLITDDMTTPGDVGLKDFTFGGDARVQLFNFLEGSALALYTPGYEVYTYPPAIYLPYIRLFLDAGVNFNLSLIGFGAGIGPNLLFVLSEYTPDPFDLGFNIKTHLDLNLGAISLSLSYLMVLDSLSDEALASLFENMNGFIGVSVLMRIF
jgi:hypothetical protein